MIDSNCPNCGALLQTLELEKCDKCRMGIRRVSLSKQNMKPAGFLIRSAAYLIDIFLVNATGLLILMGLFSILSISFNPVYLYNPTPQFEGARTLALIILIFFNIFYFAFAESSNDQATIGKNIMGLIVVDENMERISFWRSLGRYIGLNISVLILGIGFWMIPFTKNYQGLHDKIASTFVIYKKEIDKSTNLSTVYTDPTQP